MATSRSYIKFLETTREIAFSVSGGWNSATCIWNSFPEVLHKRSVLKNVLKFTDKHKKQSSGVALSKETIFLTILQNSQKNIFSGVSFLIKLPAGSLRPLEATTEDVL